MRLVPIMSLLLAASALGACTGAETTGANLSLACGLNCPDPVPPTPPTSVPVPSDPNDPNSPPNTNVGNPTGLSSGDTTIALEYANIISPATGSLSTLARTAAPNTAKISIDTKASSNANWPIPKTMDEYVYGTNLSGGVGLGGAYKEYRAVTFDGSTNSADEELQVWDWGASYATQYRDIGSKGEARHQAWSFGGTRTKVADMPTGGGAVYTGRYAATSKTWGFVDDPAKVKTITANNSWRIEGTSAINADFANKSMTGTLTPSTWTAWQTLNGATGWATVNSGNAADPNHMNFMDSKVILKGTITGNAVAGKATFDPNDGWVSGTNPMYAGFFGAGAPTQVTGAYNFVSVGPDPIGGNIPINDDRRGYVQQSGIFHGQ